MRVAVISDVHANLHALEAVVRQIELEGVDEIWNLGDTVGYGPRPNECCELIAPATTLSLAGNHDLAAIGQLRLDEFTPAAAAAADWTRKKLSKVSRAFLEGLGPFSRIGGCALYHGSPIEPVWSYVAVRETVKRVFALTEEAIVLVGHTHVALVGSLENGRVALGPPPVDTRIDLSSGRWLLNPGSVGQPRDGDWRASYLLLDLGSGSAELRRAEYDLERTQKEIRKHHLPEQLASRLARGI